MSITVNPPYEVEGTGLIMTDEALQFIEELHERFAPTRDELLGRRSDAQAEAAQTGALDFDPATKEIRESDWTVAETPASSETAASRSPARPLRPRWRSMR